MIPLRDRIADLLAHHPAFNFKDEGYSAEDVLTMADAVIRELDTDCVYRYACPHCGDFWFDKSERMQRFALLHGKAHPDE